MISAMRAGVRQALTIVLMVATLGIGTISVRADDPWSCAPAIAATPMAASPFTPPPFPDGGGTLTVFAAASLTDPVTELAETLMTSQAELDIRLNFAGSQTLVTQVTEGASADLLLLAGTGPMERALADDLIAGEPQVFAGNQMVLIVPADNPAGLTVPADLAGDKIRLVLAAPDVPAGQYARESLCLMGQDVETYGSDFVEKVAANLVSEESSVKAVLAKVALGEADAGIVYVSDITAEQADTVAMLSIDSAVNVIATYPAGVVAGGNEALATWFLGVLLGSEGQRVLQEYGFLPVS